MATPNESTAPTPTSFLSGNTPTILAGWFVTYMILLIAAESSPSVAPLAAAFAWLIAVSVIYSAGPALWDSLGKMIEKGSLTSG